MYDEPTYLSEKNNELNYDECVNVLSSFEEFCQKMNVNGRISFTGGDPMLKEGIYDLISEAKTRGFRVGILGNPFEIDDESVSRLGRLGISHYQLSLDGLEKTHDYFRKPGSFRKTMESVDRLKNEGIKVHLMNTLSLENEEDLIPLMDLAAEKEVDAFAFGRITCNGTGKQFKKSCMTPEHYREILVRADKHIKELYKKGVKTKYAHKCHLWKLLMYENGEITLPENKDVIFGGCSIGISGIVLLADGTAMACRRFPSYVGNVKNNSLYELFMSDKMNEYRKVENMEKCGKCDLLQICRGCPAVSYGIYGKWDAADPQCWKVV